MAIRNVMKTLEYQSNTLCNRIDRKNGVPTSVRVQSDKPLVYYPGGLSPKEQYLKEKRELANSFRI